MSGGTMSYRSARTRLVAIVSMGGLAAGAMIAGTSPAAATTHVKPVAKQKLSTYYLYVNSQKLTSSTHKKFKLSFTGYGSPHTTGGGAATASGNVTVALPNGDESHLWGFRLTPSQFTADPKAGTGTFKTGKSFGKYGKAKLKITPKGKLKQRKPCSSLTYTTRTVVLNGLVAFNTRSGKHGWGVLKRRHFRATGVLDGDYGTFTSGCESNFPPARCSTGLFASVFGNGPAQHDANINLSASRENGASTVYVSRSHALSDHSNLTDTIQTKVKNLAIKNRKGNKTVTLAGANNRVHGSATWTATGPPTVTTPDYCTNKVKNTQYNAVFKNGKTPIKFIPDIGKPITIVTKYSVAGNQIDGLSGEFHTTS
ncbi:MAG: hypothetical protein JO214_15455 [Frankiaceae bacterium]|nr:hypothetical protein [Frankiaceae bacterium]